MALVPFRTVTVQHVVLELKNNMGGNSGGNKNPPDKSKNKPLRNTLLEKSEISKIIPSANQNTDDRDQADNNPNLDKDCNCTPKHWDSSHSKKNEASFSATNANFVFTPNIVKFIASFST